MEALQDIQKSIEMNDNRAVYRSRLLLDRDIASRSASLAQIYSDLGFEQLALVEGWKSLETDPANYSAHRFLSDSYAALPRHEVARSSELLQAQLLQPINVNPVQPQIVDIYSYIPQEALPSGPTFNEYSPLFERDRFAFQTNLLAGSNSTFADDVVQSGMFGRYSYSLGQFHYETDGFRENNDQDKDIYNAFAQVALSAKTSIMAEYHYDDRENGDLEFLFDPESYSGDKRRKELVRSMRLGLKHEFNPRSMFIATGIGQDFDGGEKGSYPGYLTDGNGVVHDYITEYDRSDEKDGYLAEMQHILTMDRFTLTSGFGYFRSEHDITSQATFHFLDPSTGEIVFTSGIPPSTQEKETKHTNFYLHSRFHFPCRVELTLGLNADLIESGLANENFFSPKMGVVWEAYPDTTVRAAAFRTVRRSLISQQTIQPTEVAGFNQLINDTEGTESWRYGLAVDRKFSDTVFAGAEFTTRDGKTPVYVSSETGMRVEPFDWDEDAIRGYLYWTPSSRMAFGAEYFYERTDTGSDLPDEGFYRNITTHRFPLSASFFWKSGVSWRLGASYVEQEYGKLVYGSDDLDRDCFWLVDLGLSYRLAERLGIVSFQISNVFDESFNYQDTDPSNPRFVPERQFFVKTTFAF